MDDLKYASLFFLVFAAALLAYGGAIAASGNEALLPYRARLSIGGPEDVKRVGRITMVVGAVIGVVAGVVFLTRM